MENNFFVETPTLILTTKNFKHIGSLYSITDINYVDNLNGANELSFTVYKKDETLWEEIKDLRVIWFKEKNEFFEIKVQLDDEHDTNKKITGMSLCESELSKIKLYGIEINTDNDLIDGYYKYDSNTGIKEYIQGTGYGIGSTFFNSNNHAKSIIHRVLDKAVNFEIGHIDDSLKVLDKIPEFKFDDTDIYSALNNISEEFDCLFKYEIKYDSSEDIYRRIINIYDLESVCEDCGYRGIYNDICPECSGTDIKFYGDDTTIYTSVDNLTDSITLEANIDNYFNVFRLDSGDDLMNSVIINCNCGSQYIYNINQLMFNDMSDGLIERIKKYEKTVNDLQINYSDLTKKWYNYSAWHSYFLSSMMPSTALQSNVTADTEVSKISQAFTTYNNSIALPTKSSGKTTVVNAIKVFAKSFVFSGEVNTDIETSSCTFGYDNQGYINQCSGVIVVKMYSDNSSSTYNFNVSITNDYPTYVNQRIDNIMSDYKTLENLDVLKIKDKNILRNTLIGADPILSITDSTTLINSIGGLTSIDFAKSHNVGYSYNRIKSFYDAYASAVNMLNQLDQTYITSFKNKYEELMDICNQCLEIRQAQVDTFDPQNVSSPTYKSQIQISILSAKMSFNTIIHLDDITKELYYKTNSSNPNKMLVTSDNKSEISLYIPNIAINDYVIYNYTNIYEKEFFNFRREDTYLNSNYSSENLDIDTLYERGMEFVNVAKKELLTSSSIQYTVSSNLANFLLIPDFKPIVKYFKVGNWIRIGIDENEEPYRLRLSSYSINYNSINSIQCEFTNATKTGNGYDDVSDILSKASNMSSSYSTVTRQAEAGNKAITTIQNFITDGLNSALNVIKNNTNEDFLIDNKGILGRNYDPFLDSYDSKQLKITHNLIMFTDDNWSTSSLALGEHSYKKWNTNAFVTDNGYGLTAKFVSAGHINGSQIIGGDLYSENHTGTNSQTTNGMHIDLNNGYIYSPNFEWNGSRFHIGDSNDYLNWTSNGLEVSGNFSSTYFSADQNGASITGTITANSGQIGGWNISKNSDGSLYYGILGSSNGIWLSPKGIYGKINNYNKNWLIGVGNKFGVTIDGSLYANNVRIEGDIIASNIYSSDPLDTSKGYPAFSLLSSGKFTSTHYLNNTNSYDVRTTIESGNVIIDAYKDTDIKYNLTSSPILLKYSEYYSYDSRTALYPGNIIISYDGINVDASLSDGLRFYAGKFNKTKSIFSIDYNEFSYNGITLNNGDIEFIGDDLFDTVTLRKEESSLMLFGSFVPGATTYECGSKNKYWNAIYTSNLYLMGDGTVLRPHSTAKNNSLGTTNYPWSKINGKNINGSTVSSDMVIMGNTSCRPIVDGGASLGTSNYRWREVFSDKGVINTSDETMKNSIDSINEKYEKLFFKINPVTFKFNSGDRTHIGAISQQIETAMNELNISADEFGGFCKDFKYNLEIDDKGNEYKISLLNDTDEDEYIYGLRYSEFIMLNTHMIQKLYKKVDELEGKLEEFVKYGK